MLKKKIVDQTTGQVFSLSSDKKFYVSEDKKMKFPVSLVTEEGEQLDKSEPVETDDDLTSYDLMDDAVDAEKSDLKESDEQEDDESDEQEDDESESDEDQDKLKSEAQSKMIVGEDEAKEEIKKSVDESFNKISKFAVAIDVKKSLVESIGLDESSQEKVATLFEAAVNTKIKSLVESVKDDMLQALEKQVQNINEIHKEQINSYMNYVVESWTKKNSAALSEAVQMRKENKAMVEVLQTLAKFGLAESAKNSTKEALKESDEKNLKLRGMLSKLLDEHNRLTEDFSAMKKDKIFAELTEGLVDTQKEKVKALLENVETADIETFKSKAKTIVEAVAQKETVLTEVKTSVKTEQSQSTNWIEAASKL